MSTIIVFIILTIILCISYKFSTHVFFSPQTGMVIGFWIAIAYGLFYIQKWDFVISIETSLLICISIIFYVAGSVFFQYLLNKKYPLRNDNVNKHIDEKINVERWKLIIFLLIQIFVFVWLYYFLLGATGDSDFFNAIYRYRLGESSATTPKVISLLRGVSMASGHVFTYMILHQLVYKYKSNRMLLILNIICSVLVDLTSGSRGHIVVLFVGAIVQLYFIYVRKSGIYKLIKIQDIVKILLIIILAVMVFSNLDEFVGRESSKTLVDKIAIYLSAPIKNLDIFISRHNNEFVIQPLENNDTLKNFIAQIAEYLRINTYVHNDATWVRYESINGFWLGNVYTMFGSFLYDGGYLFVFIYIAIMIIITNLIFWMACKNNKNRCSSVWIILYGYTYFTIVFSVFSPRFYHDMLGDFFLKIFLYWIILEIFFCRIKVKWGK